MSSSGISNNSVPKFTLANLQLSEKLTVVPADNTSVKAAPVVVEPTKTDTKEIKTANSKYESLLNLSFVNDSAQVEQNQPAKAEQVQQAKTTSKADRPKNLDSRADFHNTNLATADDINKILKRYNSPHQGKGQVILDACKKHGVNPIMMLAIMQQESQFGSTNLKPENQANPFSVHFNHSAKGIAKLRLPNGKLPTFEQSLEGGIKTVLKLSGDSSTPLTTAGKKYSESGNWTSLIKQHYKTLLTRY